MIYISEHHKETILRLFDITGVTNMVYSIGGAIVFQLNQSLKFTDKLDNLPFIYTSTIIAILWAIINGYIRMNKWIIENKERKQKMILDRELHDMSIRRERHAIEQLENELKRIEIKRIMGRVAYELKDDDLYSEANQSESGHIERVKALIEKQKERDKIRISKRLE